MRKIHNIQMRYEDSLNLVSLYLLKYYNFKKKVLYLFMDLKKGSS